MMHDESAVARVISLRSQDDPPRISDFGNQVVSDIADRCGAPKTVVLRAMLATALHHQSELRDNIRRLLSVDPADA